MTPPVKNTREFPRTPGKLKEAMDAAYAVMREVGINPSPAPSLPPAKPLEPS